jgi:hypothetical protein
MPVHDWNRVPPTIYHHFHQQTCRFVPLFGAPAVTSNDDSSWHEKPRSWHVDFGPMFTILECVSTIDFQAPVRHVSRR